MRRFLISAANSGPNRFHQNRTVRSTALRAVTDVDATLEQQIFNLPQREGIADVEHHREADHLRRAVEITEWILHPPRLRTGQTRIKRSCFGTAGGQITAAVWSSGYE